MLNKVLNVPLVFLALFKKCFQNLGTLNSEQSKLQKFDFWKCYFQVAWLSTKGILYHRLLKFTEQIWTL